MLSERHQRAGYLSSLITKSCPACGKSMRPAVLEKHVLAVHDRLTQLASNDPALCWEWPGHIDSEGYGRIKIDGHTFLAHRFVYECLTGLEIPRGLTLDHLCRNTSCVNPAHLEPVTIAENCLRGIGPSAVNKRKVACPQGHAYDYTSPKGRRGCRRCAAARARLARKAAAA